MKNHAPPPPRASTTTAAMMIMIIIFFLPPPVGAASTLGSAFILGFAFKSTSATCWNGSRRHYVIIGKDCAAGYVEKRAEGRLTRAFPCVTGNRRLTLCGWRDRDDELMCAWDAGRWRRKSDPQPKPGSDPARVGWPQPVPSSGV